MKITLVRHSALWGLRVLRRRGDEALPFSVRQELVAPDPGPYARWTHRRIAALVSGLGLPVDGEHPVRIGVPDKDSRVQVRGVSNVVRGKGMPALAYVDAGDGVSISSPELLFAEMARYMTDAGLLMLGLELCGSFSRDSADPIDGPVTMGVAPVTSAERIRSFLAQVKGMRGIERARGIAGLVADNAWSPTESVVAAMASLPVAALGYELGPLVLNRRIETPDDLQTSAVRESRVPDILFGETGVGINYDGEVHLDLDSIARAVAEASRDSGDPLLDRTVKRAMREVRAKVVDDIRRNRELAADGLMVLPVVKEDLYERGGLDAVMLQVIAGIENRTGRRLELQRKAFASARMRDKRHEMLKSLLPRTHGIASGLVLSPGTGSDAYVALGI